MPSPTVLVSLADAKTQLQIGDTDHDTELQGFIDAAQEMVSFRTGGTVPAQQTEVRDGGSPVIMLDFPPVFSVDVVTEYWGLTAYTLTSQPLGSSTSMFGYSLDDPISGKLVRRSATGSPMPFFGGKNSVSITYTTGRGVVPPAIRLGTLRLIEHLWQAAKIGSGGGRPSVGGGAQYPPTYAMPDFVVELLEPYLIGEGIA